MLAPAQNMRSLPLVNTTTRTAGCSKRMRFRASLQLDVDAEVIGVELELVPGHQSAVLGDVEGKGRDMLVDRQLPVPVAGGIGVEGDHRVFPWCHAAVPPTATLRARRLASTVLPLVSMVVSDLA